MEKNYKYLGASIGHGANQLGCELAPAIIHQAINPNKQLENNFFYNGDTIKIEQLLTNKELKDFFINLSNEVYSVVKKKQPFVVLGGDHSCAFATWSAVAKAKDDFALIWLDSHYDLHNCNTSMSKNIHGMALGSLLKFENSLTQIIDDFPALKTENIFHIGAKSYEKEEELAVKQYDILGYPDNNLKNNSFKDSLLDVLQKIKNKNISFGISFDMDIISSTDIFAVNTPVKGNIRFLDILSAFNDIKFDDYGDFLGFEIVEYNPLLDKKQQDLQKAIQILTSLR